MTQPGGALTPVGLMAPSVQGWETRMLPHSAEVVCLQASPSLWMWPGEGSEEQGGGVDVSCRLLLTCDQAPAGLRYDKWHQAATRTQTCRTCTRSTGQLSITVQSLLT